MKFFREKDESYTEEANAFDREVTAALRPIFEKYRQGAKVRDMQYVAISAVDCIALSRLITDRAPTPDPVIRKSLI